MLIIDISRQNGISKKTGQPYDSMVITGISRRLSGQISASSVWVNPNNPGLHGLKPGDQVRIAQDGGEQYITNLNDPAGEELQLLLSKLM